MQIKFSYRIDSDHFDAEMLRFVQFLKEKGAEAVSGLTIQGHFWRNGKRLQAVNDEGIIRPVTFDIEPGDSRYQPLDRENGREKLTVRERPDELGEFGLATAFDRDD